MTALLLVLLLIGLSGLTVVALVRSLRRDGRPRVPRSHHDWGTPTLPSRPYAVSN